MTSALITAFSTNRDLVRSLRANVVSVGVDDYAETILTAGANNAVLTSNVVTLTIDNAYRFSVGDEVVVDLSNNAYDGTYTLTAVTSTTISYALTHANIAAAQITGTVQRTTADRQVVFLTRMDHDFQVGQVVGVYGLDDTFDGAFPILAVSDRGVVVENASVGTQAVAAVSDVTLHFPADQAYVRWPGTAAQTGTIDALLLQDSALLFNAEPWDYHTVRISWSMSPAVDALLQDDIQDDLVPRVAITRSSFGYPTTINDGERIGIIGNDVEPTYASAVDQQTMVVPLEPYAFNLDPASIGMVPNQADLDYIRNYSDHPPEPGIPFKREAAEQLSIYDQHLAGGRWYYYTLFALMSYQVDNYLLQHWVRVASTQALVPMDYRHRDTLYGLIPPYYQEVDKEFTAGTRETRGALEQLCTVIGFDLDYTRTLAEGVQDVYDLDRTSHYQLASMGEQNFGIEFEQGLGATNYRSLVASLNRLYGGRGTPRTLQQLCQIVSKFPCVLVEGLNLLLLTDDAEFAEGSGSWAVPYNDGGDYDVGTIGGLSYNGTDPTFVSTIDPDPNVTWHSPKKGALHVSNDGSDWVLCCGAGLGFTVNRYHDLVSTGFVPYYNGIRCLPGTNYQFTFYMYRAEDDGDIITPADVQAGIMWFGYTHGDDYSDWSVASYLDQTSGDAAVDSNDLTQYHVESTSPSTHPLVYGVPFITVSGGDWDVLTEINWYVSSCMFNRFLNEAAPDESMLGNHLLVSAADPDHVIGGVKVLGTD